MVHLTRFYTHRRERGITLMFVVIAIFALLGMMALAIDLVTLYVSKSEAQRVADAAALAGAKVLVDGGVTADPTNAANQWDTACDLATVQAQKIAGRGSIGGVAPTPAQVSVCFGFNGSCSTSCPSTGTAGSGFGVNPEVGVTVQSSQLPLFFAKIWGPKTATASATSLAEGFNPSGTSTPVAAKCVMPWLLANLDPTGGGPIIDTSSGQMLRPGPSGVIGEQITMSMGCNPDCGTPTPPTPSKYYPLDLPNPAASGPSCSAGTNYQKNILSCNPTPIACGQTVTLDTSVVKGAANDPAIECLIGASGPGLGPSQDSVDPAFPFAMEAGNNNPLVVSGVIFATNVISSSRSVVTIPVYDSTLPTPAPGSSQTVIGFVQGFITSSTGGDPVIQVLNVSGCGTAARGSSVPPVGTNEASAVPVRLIHQ
jgi:Flp pilus assembly protein TadG